MSLTLLLGINSMQLQSGYEQFHRPPSCSIKSSRKAEFYFFHNPNENSRIVPLTQQPWHGCCGVYGQGNISQSARVESPVLLHADRGRAEGNSIEAARLLIKEKGKDVMWGRQPLSTTVSKTISRKMDQGTLAATVGLRDVTVTSSLHPPLADPHPVFFPTWGSSHRVEDMPPKTNHLQFAPQFLKNSSPCPSNLS